VNRAGAGTNAAVTGYNAEGWTTVGGSPVVLAQGETVNALANRYGVPAEAIYRSNRIANGSVVAPGTRLTIPIYRGAGASPAAAPARPAPKPAASAPARPAAPKVAVGPAKPAEPAKVAASRPEPAKPAPAKPEPKVAAPAKPEKPAAPKIADAKQPKPEPAKPAARPASAKPEPAKPAQAKAEPAKPAARVADARPAPAAAPAAPPANETKVTRNEKPEPQTTGSVAANSPDFRWPARGRIISGFRNNGNDGINIAVPEGTPVKAADEGTVAYAGSELKGYGNLVLVRHANGYVSAYAHNGDLKVRKGDSVKRGQTIATSGQSGNVASPQLHFEIRRGSTPVDPSTYLQN
jgi:murein DD-endopeptidase MepM/ murein hydrolase activator NlpD